MLSEMQRTLRAQKLRNWLIENDPDMQRSIATSKAADQQRNQRHEANRKAADALGLAIGDRVMLRSRGHRFDGRSGELTEFKELPNGRRLGTVVVKLPRSGPVQKPPARIGFQVDVELLHKV